MATRGSAGGGLWSSGHSAGPAAAAQHDRDRGTAAGTARGRWEGGAAHVGAAGPIRTGRREVRQLPAIGFARIHDSPVSRRNGQEARKEPD